MGCSLERARLLVGARRGLQASGGSRAPHATARVRFGPCHSRFRPARSCGPRRAALDGLLARTEAPRLPRPRRQGPHSTCAALDRTGGEPIPGTESAAALSFRPTGSGSASSRSGELKKVSLAGGAPLTVRRCLRHARGEPGHPTASIYFAWIENSGLRRVRLGRRPRSRSRTPDLEGRRARARVAAIPARAARSFSLSSGRERTFRNRRSRICRAPLAETGQAARAVSRASPSPGTRRPAISFSSGARRSWPLRSIPGRWELSGPPSRFSSDVLIGDVDGAPTSRPAETGLLAYASGAMAQRGARARLSGWTARAGKSRSPSRRDYSDPRLSPDGKGFALGRGRRSAGEHLHVRFRAQRPLALVVRAGPVFQSDLDARRPTHCLLVFQSGCPKAFWKAADGSGEARTADTERA